jgi:hypothetical protein
MMRKFTLTNIEKQYSFKTPIKEGLIFELVPEIKREYTVENETLRCSEHQRGYMVLKNEKMILKFKEVF